MFKSLLLLLCVVFATVIVGCEGRNTPPPINCGTNEVYLKQGMAPNCDTVCSELGKPCMVTYIWAPFGCYCKPDYARNSDDACIPIRECPK